MHHKVRDGQNLPNESPNFTNFFSSKWLYVQFKPFFHKSETRLPKQFFLNNFFLFSILNSRISKNMCIWRHKLCNSKTGIGPTFTWSNEPWFRGIYYSLVNVAPWHPSPLPYPSSLLPPLCPNPHFISTIANQHGHQIQMAGNSGLLDCSLNRLSGSSDDVCVCVCAIAENPLPAGLETSGWRV